MELKILVYVVAENLRLGDQLLGLEDWRLDHR